jgi:chromosome segregation ATPase
MNQGNHISNQLSALHRQIDAARQELGQLEQKKQDIKMRQEEASREKAVRMREVSGLPDSVQRISALTHEMHGTLSAFFTDLGRVNEEIRTLERKIEEKKRECERLV